MEAVAQTPDVSKYLKKIIGILGLLIIIIVFIIIINKATKNDFKKILDDDQQEARNIGIPYCQMK